MTNFLRNGWLLAACIFSFAGIAQNSKPDPIKFGKIDMADLQMNIYSKDSSASAVVLCDYSKVYYNMVSSVYGYTPQTYKEHVDAPSQRSYSYKFEVVQERICRIKILKKSGYEWATQVIANFSQKSGIKDRIDKIKASTYSLENGKIVESKLKSSDIFEERRNENIILEKFTLPNVHEGSIIEFEYTIFSERSQVPSWEFQRGIPTAWSEYRVAIPEYYYFRPQMQGYEQFVVNEKILGTMTGNAGNSQTTVNTTEFRWALKDVPALKEEPFMTTIDDYVTKIDFDLAAVQFPNQRPHDFSVTWEDLSTQLLKSESFGKQLNRYGFLKDAAATIRNQTKDTLESIGLALKFVQKNVKWNDRNGLVVENDIKTAFGNKLGNAADMNLMLVNLLRELGHDANPVILSTRSHGRISEGTLLLSKFNYTIAQMAIDGKDLLLDATDPLLKIGMLPTRCLNGTGRLIAKEAALGRWISLDPEEKNSKTVILNLNINPEGHITGAWNVYHNGYAALAERKKIGNLGKEKYMEEFKKSNDNLEVKTIDVDNTTESDKLLEIKTEIKAESAAQAANGRIYFKPLLSESQDNNPFQFTSRKFPIDLSMPLEEIFTATYTLPEGYVIEELPKGAKVVLADDGGRFSFLVNATAADKIMVSSKIILKKPLYFAEEYEDLKQLFNQIIAKHAEQIVLKKQ